MEEYCEIELWVGIRLFIKGNYYSMKTLLLVILIHASATSDAFTTRKAILRGGYESNPILKPFSHSTPDMIAFTNSTALPLSITFAKYHNKKWAKAVAISTIAAYSFLIYHNAKFAAHLHAGK